MIIKNNNHWDYHEKTLFLIFALGVLTTNSYAWCPEDQVNVKIESMLFEDEGFHSLAVVVSDGQSFNFRYGEHDQRPDKGHVFWVCAVPGSTMAFTLFKENSVNTIEQISCGNVTVHDDLNSVHIIDVDPEGYTLSRTELVAEHKEPEYLKSNNLPPQKYFSLICGYFLKNSRAEILLIICIIFEGETLVKGD